MNYELLMSLTLFVKVLQVAEAVSLEQERNSISTAGGLYFQLVSFACLLPRTLCCSALWKLYCLRSALQAQEAFSRLPKVLW